MYLNRMGKRLEIGKRILALGIPIIIGQLGGIAQQFADTIMVGNYGNVDLAAAGFVNQVFMIALFFLLGMSYATTPVVGTAFGSGNKEGIQRSLVDTVVVNFVFSSIVMAILLLLYFNIGIFDQPKEIVPIAKPYFLVLILSVPFLGIFNALKQFSDAIGETTIPMWVMIFSNALNIVLNWLLIFGFGHIPSMGLLGAGIATLISRAAMTIAMCLFLLFHVRYKSFTKQLFSFRPQINGMKRIVKIGTPICVQLGLENSSFNICAIFMGWIGIAPLAAHQIMTTVSTLCFQVIYGIGAAGSVIISQYKGRGEIENMRITASTAWHIGFLSTLVMTCLIFFSRHHLIGLFTNDPEITTVTLTLLFPFMVYQIGDCTQIVYANALRGIESVKKMMFYAFFAYFIISLPLSYLLAFKFNLGPLGIWSGIPFGLTIAGVLFYFEYKRGLKKMLLSEKM